MAELKAYGAAATEGAACEAAATDQRGVQQELPHQTSETVEAAATDKRRGVKQ